MINREGHPSAPPSPTELFPFNPKSGLQVGVLGFESVPLEYRELAESASFTCPSPLRPSERNKSAPFGRSPVVCRPLFPTNSSCRLARELRSRELCKHLQSIYDGPRIRTMKSLRINTVFKLLSELKHFKSDTIEVALARFFLPKANMAWIFLNSLNV